jgi:lipopolysaccharide export system protein LptA
VTRPGWLILWLLVVAVFPPTGASTEAAVHFWKAGSEPLHVDAKSLEYRGREGIAVFEGDVVARQGDLTLQADRLAVGLDPKTREIRSIEAAGNVRIQAQIEGKEITAVGERATYDAGSGVMDLTGDPKIWTDRDAVTGDRIIFYLAEDRYVVENPIMTINPGRPGEGEGQ